MKTEPDPLQPVLQSAIALQGTGLLQFCSAPLYRALQMQNGPERKQDGNKTMISQKLANMLLPTDEENNQATLAFLDGQADKSATEEELIHLLGVFRFEVVRARVTLALLGNLKLGNVSIVLDGDKLSWRASERGRSRGID